MKTSESILKIAPALLRAQRKMGAATKGSSNPFFKSKYSDYNSVLEVVKEPLNEEGILVMQQAFSDSTGHYVETLLVHESGEYLSSGALRLELTKLDSQALGSGITYLRRYQLQSLLSIPSVDDDFESGMTRAAPTKESTTSSLAQVETKKVSSFKKPTAPAASNGSTTEWV